MRSIKDGIENIKLKTAQLKAAKAYIKKRKTEIKLGDESIHYTVKNDGEKTWYEVDVNIIDCVDENVYRKTHNIYKLPYGKKFLLEELYPRAAIEVFKDYLIDSLVVHVNSKNKIIEYEPTESKKI